MSMNKLNDIQLRKILNFARGDILYNYASGVSEYIYELIETHMHLHAIGLLSETSCKCIDEIENKTAFHLPEHIKNILQEVFKQKDIESVKDKAKHILEHSEEAMFITLCSMYIRLTKCNKKDIKTEEYSFCYALIHVLEPRIESLFDDDIVESGDSIIGLAILKVYKDITNILEEENW